MSKYALCPFYEFAEKKHLYCEGATLDFPNSDDRSMWLKLHCCSWDFKICKFYKGLMKKYECE